MCTGKRVISIGGVILLLSLALISCLYGQAQEPRDYQRWGKFGVGKLVTTQNNLNCIGDGQMRWPVWAHHPAMEYPYNPEPGGRHIMYTVGMSFHIGGYCEDYGPAFDPAQSQAGDNPTETPRFESADRTYYRYYDGFHFDGLPEYVAPAEDASVPVSDDPSTWPALWPEQYPAEDWYHSSRYPEYRNVYQSGLTSPVPLLIDSTTGWPGVGPHGELLADQESFSVNFSRNREVVEDPDLDDGKLMVYTVLRGLSYGGDFYDDFLVYQWAVTNISPKPITETYLGMLVDFDFPWACYAGYSSYNETDCYAYDHAMQMAYGWDGDGEVAGATYGDWDHPEPAKLTDESIVENPALAGVMFLKTPQKDDGSGELGVTSFDAFYIKLKDSEYGMGSSHYEFYWNNVANNRFATGEPGRDPDDLDGDGIDDWTWEHPFPVGNEAVYREGHKCEFTINTGPFTLEPGETETLTVAVVMGESRDALFKNARFAQQLYDNDWKPLKPPLDPVVRTEVGSGYVRLIWDDRSESDSLNTLYNREPFEGYKIYRSKDGGLTWGSLPITDENGTTVDYVPLGQWDLANGITGASSVLPTFQRGTDSGLGELLEVVDSDTAIIEVVDGDTIFYGEFFAGDTTGRRIFLDESVIDGFTYRYAVVAYSAGNEETEIPPVQSSKSTGTQIVSVVPHGDKATIASELDLIRVVPNPYRVIADWELSQDERMIKFTRLPQRCTIQIYNVAGEWIRTLEHNENSPVDSEEVWNLRTHENREVAPGLYFYYITSALGAKTGKFVIIK